MSKIYVGDQEVTDLPGVSELWAPHPVTGIHTKVWPNKRWVAVFGPVRMSHGGIVMQWNQQKPILGDPSLVNLHIKPKEERFIEYVSFNVPVVCDLVLGESAETPAGTVLQPRRRYSPSWHGRPNRSETYFTFTEV